MDGPTVGLIGGIAGSVIGVLGGAVGTYFSVRNTRGPLERAFLIRCAVVAWIAITIFLALMFLLPSPHRHYLWIPYAILLPVAIRYGNHRQREIFRQEHGG